MCPAVASPGPANQKSVPGLWHRVNAFPLEVTCSVSSPRAIEPLAWTTTPPLAGMLATACPLTDGDGLGVAEDDAAGACTRPTVSLPGLLTLICGALPAAPRLATDACPVPLAAGPAIKATRAAGAPARPGAGQPRSTAATPAAAGTGTSVPAANVRERLSMVSPAAAASTAKTATNGRIR